MKKLYAKCLKHAKKHFNLYLIAAAVIISIPLLFVVSAPTKDAMRNAAGPRLTVELPIPNGSYSIFSDTNKLVLHDSGMSKSFQLPDGTYRIEFAGIYGYTTPQKRVFRINDSSDVVIKGNYYPVYRAPLLAVQVFPEYAPYKIYDLNKKLIQEGTGSQFFRLPPGQYTIDFEDIAGYDSPGMSNFYLAGTVVTTVSAAYGEKK